MGYLRSAPSHLSSAHRSVCSSSRVQFFTRKPAILHDGVGVFARSSKKIPGWYFEPRSPNKGVLYFQNVKLFAGTLLRVMYGLSCTDFQGMHIAQSLYLQIACTGIHLNRTIWQSRLETHVPPYVKNVITTILTTHMPARHNFVRKFYTEFDENQTSGSPLSTQGWYQLKDKKIQFSFFFISVCSLCFDWYSLGIMTYWIPDRKVTHQNFFHRYLGRRGTAACLHTRRIFGYRRNARDCSRRITTNQHVLPPHRQQRADERQGRSVCLLRTICWCLSVCLSPYTCCKPSLIVKQRNTLTFHCQVTFPSPKLARW
jgi:hypothetical protein